MTDSGRLVVYGATGSTGRRVTEVAAAAGLEPVLAGRRRDALESMAAPHGLEVRVADLEPAALDSALEAAGVVVSCAGPYSLIGRPVADAAVRAGAHYVDFSGEPRWVQGLIDEVDRPARAAGTAIVPAVGGSTVGDLAAQLAARSLPRVEAITVGLRIVGMRPSSASIRSSVELVAGGAPVVDARVRRFEKAGGRTRDLPGGPGALFPSPDALLLGRVWPEAHCETYMQFPAFRFTGPAFAAAASGLSQPSILALTRRALAAARRPLSRLRGSGGRVVATAVAQGGGERSVARAFSDGIYDLTAVAAGVAIQHLLSADEPPSGVRSWGEVTGKAEAAAAEAGVRLTGPTLD